MRRLLRTLLYSCAAFYAVIGLSGAQSDPARALDWTLGQWEGTRENGANGSQEPMTMRVESILGGAGQARHLEVRGTGGIYRGFSVQIYDADRDVWARQYVNNARGTFSSLQGKVESETRSVWASESPRRRSRLISERLGQDGWRRTMTISEDGGATWRTLWIDQLRRVERQPSP